MMPIEYKRKKEKFKGYLINLIDRTTIHGTKIFLNFLGAF